MQPKIYPFGYARGYHGGSSDIERLADDVRDVGEPIDVMSLLHAQGPQAASKREDNFSRWNRPALGDRARLDKPKKEKV